MDSRAEKLARLQELQAKRDQLMQLKARREELIRQRDSGQAAAQQSQQEQPNFIHESLRNLPAARLAMNLGAGLGTAGQNVLSTLTGNWDKQPTALSQATAPMQHVQDIVARGIGQAAPFAAGASPLGLAAGGAAFGLTQQKPGEEGIIDRSLGLQPSRIRNAVEDAVLGMLTGGIGKAIPKVAESISNKPIVDKTLRAIGLRGNEADLANAVASKIKQPEPLDLSTGRPLQANPYETGYKWGVVPEDFQEAKIQTPSFLEPEPLFAEPGLERVPRPVEPEYQQPPEIPARPESKLSPPAAPELPEAPQPIPNRSNQVAEQIKQHITGGQGFTQARENFARIAKDAFEKVKAPGKALYDKIFKAPEFTNAEGIAKEYPELFSDEEARTRFKDSNLDVYKQFGENPTLENAQEAKTMMKKQRERIARKEVYGSLNPQERIDINNFKNDINHLENKMNEMIERDAPHLKDALAEADKYWKDNVAKWYFDPDLYKVITGKEVNPQQGKIASIFKSPEPETEQIVNSMGDPAKRAIIQDALGKKIHNVGEIDTNLDLSGHGKYMTPELQSGLNEYKGHVAREAENAEAIQRHAKLVKQSAKEFDSQVKTYRNAKSVEEQQYNDLVANVKSHIEKIDAQNAAVKKAYDDQVSKYLKREELKANVKDELKVIAKEKKAKLDREMNKSKKKLIKGANEQKALIDKGVKTSEQAQAVKKAMEEYNRKVAEEAEKQKQKAIEAMADTVTIASTLLRPVERVVTRATVKGVKKILK